MEHEIIFKAVKAYNILKYPNVVGYSNQLMPRIRKGKVVPHEMCVRIYVVKKVPEHQLKPSEIIPKSLKLEDGREVCTDIVEVGKLKALQQLDPKQRYRPAPTGVSTSRADEMGAGTSGWYVVDEDGEVYAISNNHVWAKENKGIRGDPLVQPARLDGGDPEKDIVYTLYDFVPINFSQTALNYVDVAVAKIVNYSGVYMAILNVGGVAGKRVPEVGEKVVKHGRTTSLTEGTVTDVSATVAVEYDTGTALFTDVIMIRGLARGGDSGSPVLTQKNEFVGLLFAGSDTDFVVCKYTHIESQLSSRLGKKIRILVANSPLPFTNPQPFRWCRRIIGRLYLCYQ